MARKIKSKSKRRGRLDEVRERLQPLVDAANKRYKELKDQGFYTSSMDEALSTKSKADRRKKNPFSIDNKKRFRELQREGARIYNFLNAETTSQAGAEWEAKFIGLQENYGKLFGREFYEDYGVRYDASKVNEGHASMTFRVYRQLQERVPNLLADKLGYGSDNLINAIYDEIVGMDGEMTMNDRVAQATVDMERELREYDEYRQAEARHHYFNGDIDYGVLDDITDAFSRDNFLDRTRRRR